MLLLIIENTEMLFNIRQIMAIITVFPTNLKSGNPHFASKIFTTRLTLVADLQLFENSKTKEFLPHQF